MPSTFFPYKISFVFLLLVSCSEFSQMRSNYGSASYYQNSNPKSIYALELMKENVHMGRKLIKQSTSVEDHDAILTLTVFGYLGMAKYYQAKGDYLLEEQCYLDAIQLAQQYGNLLPKSNRQIYQAVNAVYRKEMVKRQCYHLLHQFYEKLQEDALKSIVELQMDFSHTYLQSNFFKEERILVQRYEQGQQEYKDANFVNDVDFFILMTVELFVFVIREANISLQESYGLITSKEAEQKRARSQEKFDKSLENIEKEHQEEQKRLSRQKQKILITPLVNNFNKLDKFPLITKLDSYERLKKITEKIKKQDKEVFSRNFVLLMEQYQTELLKVYREIREERKPELENQ